jgi:hypothetical protein
MFDVVFDTSNLARKIAESKANLRRAAIDGLEEGQSEMVQVVDDEMFVPLRFDSQVSTVATAVVSKTTVGLNLRPQPRSRSNYYRRRVKKSRASSSRKRWYHFVREFASTAKDRIEASILSTIRRRM